MWKAIVLQLKRIGMDLVLAISLFILLWVGFNTQTTGEGITTYTSFLPTHIATILYKGLLFSLGIVHGHITRKLLLPYKIEWMDGKNTYDKLFAIVVYVLCVFAYTRGG